MKLSCRQLDEAQRNPKDVAKMLLTVNAMKSGFNKVTYEVCYQLAKGLISYQEAKYLLEVRLSEEFKNNAKNKKRRAMCQHTLDNFYEFIQEEGLTCVQNYSLMHVTLASGHIIGGQGCAIFKNAEGQPVGVIISVGEFDFASTMRIPIEQYWIAKRLKLDDEGAVDIYVYNTLEQSYQTISYSKERIAYTLDRANEVIGEVELEMKKIAN